MCNSHAHMQILNMNGQMKQFTLSVLYLISVMVARPQSHINLSGVWNVRAGNAMGEVKLPGSLSENKIGDVVKDSATNMLSEQYGFVGKAKYEREINVPATWMNKVAALYIERSKVTEVFINGTAVGSQNSVSAPHVYLLKNVLKPGKNKIAITVDNTKSLLPLGGSHAYSEHTQTNWNGILGKFYLRCLNDVDINNVRIDAQTNGSCQLKLFVLHLNSEKKSAKKIAITIRDASKKNVARKSVSIVAGTGLTEHSILLRVQNPKLWDEYDPYLYSVSISIAGEYNEAFKFGFRKFETKAGQFINNGRVVFLRGTHEGGVFPLTGYPPMNKEDWINYYRSLKEYGINHVRFHSWTPPQASFEAADETGVFLQPELPLWGHYKTGDTVLFNYMKSEGERIMNAYGNHPSFVMFALGNELEGDTSLMAKMVTGLKTHDSRHLYALGSNNFYWNPQTHPVEDFFVAMRHGKEAEDYSTDLRGSFSFADSKGGGIINSLTPNTTRNFSKAIRGLNKPAIGHETGQYQVYPDYKEMSGYIGVLRPLNFAVFKNRLQKAGMLSKADDFLKASGALSALCYKEEIEMALRTPGFGGFQLLDIKDYPGQGTALVGILNAFRKSKSVISKQAWNGFCNDVVPLASFEKYCLVNNELFETSVNIANYGKADVKGKQVTCVLKDCNGTVLFQKVYAGSVIKQGSITHIGDLKIPLDKITQPSQLIFSIELAGTIYKNYWNIWVYPAEDTITIREGMIDGVMVTRNKERFESAKEQGTPVLYIPLHSEIMDKSVGGLFITDFWNYTVFKGAAEKMKREPSPGTLGIITDPAHPLFKGFPTDFHTNWQWWNIIKHSRPMILNDMPGSYFPVVQVIDNIDRNHKLGLIYECPGTKAKVLVCAADLFSCADQPEVKALFKTMIEYVRVNN